MNSKFGKKKKKEKSSEDDDSRETEQKPLRSSSLSDDSGRGDIHTEQSVEFSDNKDNKRI